jgi:hypothetical protein
MVGKNRFFVARMAYTIDVEKIIDYEPEAIRRFRSYALEWIDNLHFLLPPGAILKEPEPYIAIARECFLSAGWWSGGEINLLWVPPFVFPRVMNLGTEGVVLWHVKQEDDGISWLLSPIELPFDGFSVVRQIPGIPRDA